MCNSVGRGGHRPALRGIREGDESVHAYDGLQVSWHPGSGQLHIWFDEGSIEARMHVRNSQGHTLLHVPIAPESSPINFRDVPADHYTFSVRQPHVEEDQFEWYMASKEE